MHARINEILNEPERETQDRTDTYTSTPSWMDNLVGLAQVDRVSTTRMPISVYNPKVLWLANTQLASLPCCFISAIPY